MFVSLGTELTLDDKIQNLVIELRDDVNTTVDLVITGDNRVVADPSSLVITNDQAYYVEFKLLVQLKNEMLNVPVDLYFKSRDGTIDQHLSYMFYFIPTKKPDLYFYQTELTFFLKESIKQIYSLVTTTYPSSNIYISINNTCPESYRIYPEEGTLLADQNSLNIEVTPLANRSEGNCTIYHYITTDDPAYDVFDTLTFTIQTLNNDKTSAPILVSAIENDNENSITITFDRECYLKNENITLYERFDCADLVTVSSSVEADSCRWLNGREIILYYDKFNYTANNQFHQLTVKPNKIFGSKTGFYYTEGSVEMQLRKIPPKLIQGYYNEDYSIIYIPYDDSAANCEIGYGLDINGRKCSEIFKEKDKLKSSHCYLDRMNRHIVVELSLDSELIQPSTNPQCVGDKGLTLIDNVIKPTKDSILYMSGCVTVMPHGAVPTIAAMINVYPPSSQITKCQDVILDASASLMNDKANNKLLDYKWSVIEYDDDNNSVSTNNDLALYVAQQTDSLMKIPSLFLTTNYSYEFRVSVTTVLRESSYIATNGVYLTVVDCVILPVIESDDNSNNIYIRENEERYIKGKLIYKTCNNDSFINVKYNWSLETVSLNRLEITSFLTNDPTKLYIRPNGLKAGKYIVTLETIVLENDTIIASNTTSVNLYMNFHIRTSSLKIKSNIKQSLIQGVRRSIKINITVIDEGNYDNNNFIYKWSCVTSTFEECRERDWFNTIPLFLENTKDILLIDSSRLLECEYIFTIEVTGLTTFRTAKMMIAISIIHYDDVVINVIDSVYHSSVGTNYINPSAYGQNEIIKLESQLNILNRQNISFEWKYLNDDKIHTLIGSNDTYLAYFNCKEMNLRIPLHLIQLTIFFSEDKLLYISQYYPFYIISPIPTYGYIQSPTTETTFGENIYLSTAGWKGSEPFSYRFAVILKGVESREKGEEENNNDVIYLQSEYSNKNYYYGSLATGLKQYDYNVTIIAFVKDRYNQVAYSYYDVKGDVFKVKVNPNYDFDNIKNKVTELKNNQNYDELMNVALSLSMQISSPVNSTINCSKNGVLRNGTCICEEDYTGVLCEKHISIDGGLSSNYTYSSWSNNCGLVMRYKWRRCDNPKPQYGGKKCETVVETETKLLDPCDNNNINAAFTEWSGWSECDSYCSIYNGKRSYGYQFRSRRCIGSKDQCENQKVIDIQKCYILCKEPIKLCPGQLIDEKGQIVGNICSNRGTCYRNRDNCGEFEPNCHSWCKCNDGYNGRQCQYSTSEYNDIIIRNKYIVNEIIKDIIDKVHESVNSYYQQQQIIYNLLSNDYIQDIDEESVNDLFDVIKKQLVDMKNKKYDNIPFNMFESLTDIASNVIDNEWYNVNVKKNNTNQQQQYKIGRQLKQYFIDISHLHYNQQHSKEVTISTNAISISLSKADVSYNGDLHNSIGLSENTIDIDGGLDLTKETEVLVIYWNDLYFYNQKDLYSSVLTIVLNDNMNNNRHMSVTSKNNNDNKISYKQRLSRNSDKESISCSYFNEYNELSSQKTSLVGIVDEDKDNTEYAICISYSQADFVFSKGKGKGSVNSQLPVQFSGLEAFYDKYNFLMLLPYVITLIIFLSFLYCAHKKDNEEIDDIELISTNRIKENGRLDMYTNDEIKSNNNQENMCIRIIKKMKIHHSILSPICKGVRHLVTINRFQHVLCIIAEVYSIFCFAALFYGDFNRMENVTTVTLLCAIIVFPLNIILPYIYNKYRNYTTSSVKPINTPTSTLWLTIKRVWNIYKFNNYNEIENELNNSVNDTVDTSTNPLFITIGNDGMNNRSNVVLSNDKNPFFNLKVYLYSTTILFLIFNYVFFVVFMIIFPLGPPFLFIYITGLVLLLESTFTFYCTTWINFMYYIYDLMCNVVELAFYGFLLFTYFEELIVKSDINMMKWIWKLFYKSDIFNDIISYIEHSLHCCGYSDVFEFTTKTCSAYAVPCKQEIHNIFIKYAPLWMMFLFISVIMILMKLYFIIRILCYKFSSIAAVGVGVINVDVFNTAQTKAISDIHVYLKYVISKKKKRRCKESQFYKKTFDTRSKISILIDVALVLYVMLMLLLSIIYGIKFSFRQIITWLYTVVVSYCLDVLIQQPFAIMFYAVIRSVLTSYISKKN